MVAEDFIIVVFATLVSMTLTIMAYGTRKWVFLIASACFGIFFMGYSFANYTSFTFAGTTIPNILFAIGWLFIGVLIPVMSLFNKRLR